MTAVDAATTSMIASRWVARRSNVTPVLSLSPTHAITGGCDDTEDGCIFSLRLTSPGQRHGDPAIADEDRAHQRAGPHQSHGPHQLHFGAGGGFGGLATAQPTQRGHAERIEALEPSAGRALLFCRVPRDHRLAAPSEVWCAWSSGRLCVFNEPCNRMITALPSPAAAHGPIVALMAFHSGATVHRSGAPSPVDPAAAAAAASTLDGAWLFGRSASGATAVCAVTATGTLLFYDARSRSLIFRVPPLHTPKDVQIRAAVAAADDARAYFILASEDGMLHLVELAVRRVAGGAPLQCLPRHLQALPLPGALVGATTTGGGGGSRSRAASPAPGLSPRAGSAGGMGRIGGSGEPSSRHATPFSRTRAAVDGAGPAPFQPAGPHAICISNTAASNGRPPVVFVGSLGGAVACAGLLVGSTRRDARLIHDTARDVVHAHRGPVGTLLPMHGGTATLSIGTEDVAVIVPAAAIALSTGQEGGAQQGGDLPSLHVVDRIADFNQGDGGSAAAPRGAGCVTSGDAIILLADGAVRRVEIQDPMPPPPESPSESPIRDLNARGSPTPRSPRAGATDATDPASLRRQRGEVEAEQQALERRQRELEEQQSLLQSQHARRQAEQDRAQRRQAEADAQRRAVQEAQETELARQRDLLQRREELLAKRREQEAAVQARRAQEEAAKLRTAEAHQQAELDRQRAAVEEQARKARAQADALRTRETQQRDAERRQREQLAEAADTVQRDRAEIDRLKAQLAADRARLESELQQKQQAVEAAQRAAATAQEVALEAQRAALDREREAAAGERRARAEEAALDERRRALDAEAQRIAADRHDADAAFRRQMEAQAEARDRDFELLRQRLAERDAEVQRQEAALTAAQQQAESRLRLTREEAAADQERAAEQERVLAKMQLELAAAQAQFAAERARIDDEAQAQQRRLNEEIEARLRQERAEIDAMRRRLEAEAQETVAAQLRESRSANEAHHAAELKLRDELTAALAQQRSVEAARADLERQQEELRRRAADLEVERAKAAAALDRTQADLVATSEKYKTLVVAHEGLQRELTGKEETRALAIEDARGSAALEKLRLENTVQQQQIEAAQLQQRIAELEAELGHRDSYHRPRSASGVGAVPGRRVAESIMVDSRGPSYDRAGSVSHSRGTNGHLVVANTSAAASKRPKDDEDDSSSRALTLWGADDLPPPSSFAEAALRFASYVQDHFIREAAGRTALVREEAGMYDFYRKLYMDSHPAVHNSQWPADLSRMIVLANEARARCLVWEQYADAMAALVEDYRAHVHRAAALEIAAVRREAAGEQARTALSLEDRVRVAESEAQRHQDQAARAADQVGALKAELRRISAEAAELRGDTDVLAHELQETRRGRNALVEELRRSNDDVQRRAVNEAALAAEVTALHQQCTATRGLARQVLDAHENSERMHITATYLEGIVAAATRELRARAAQLNTLEAEVTAELRRSIATARLLEEVEAQRDAARAAAQGASELDTRAITAAAEADAAHARAQALDDALWRERNAAAAMETRARNAEAERDAARLAQENALRTAEDQQMLLRALGERLDAVRTGARKLAALVEAAAAVGAEPAAAAEGRKLLRDVQFDLSAVRRAEGVPPSVVQRLAVVHDRISGAFEGMFVGAQNPSVVLDRAAAMEHVSRIRAALGM